MYRIDKTAWENFYSEMYHSEIRFPPTESVDYIEGYNAAMSLVDDWVTGHINDEYTNRDWLDSLSPVELVCWLKNTAAAMSDAELLKWLEEKHEYR